MEAIVISESVANSASSSASSMAQVTFIALDSMVLPTFMASDSMARASNKAKERAARNDGELMPRLCRAASERAEEIKEASVLWLAVCLDARADWAATKPTEETRLIASELLASGQAQQPQGRGNHVLNRACGWPTSSFVKTGLGSRTSCRHVF